jgi:diguanylate cyclase (GGDEF)-like protein
VDSRPPRLYEDHEVTETARTPVVVPKSFRTTRRPTLMMMAGSLAGHVFRVEKVEVTIGRSKTADVTVSDQGVSRLHCTISVDGAGRYFVEDNRSTNGTIVNGGRITRVELQAGDRIQVGSEAVFQFGYFDAAEEELAMKMYEGATRDPLTRAFNRRAFFERLQSELSYATRHSEKLVIVLFDLDHFKSVNDTHGHTGGDAVLRELGKTVGNLLRTEDVFARYGGEEFVVLARGLSLKQGVKLAERIRKAVQDRAFVHESQTFHVTVSVGVAELADAKDAASAERLLTVADRRLYQAKAKGRNCVVSK